MTAISSPRPESPQEVRGKTLTPVSPKPQYYPSPANVPILELSMDPAFNDTVTQTIQEPAAPLPSTTQHTLALVEPVHMQSSSGAERAEESGATDVLGNDENAQLEASQGRDGGRIEHEMGQTTAEMLNNAASLTQGTGTDSFPTETVLIEDKSSTQPMDVSPGFEDARADAHALSAAPTQLSATNETATGYPGASNPGDPPTSVPDGNVDYTALLASLSSVIQSATSVDSTTENAAPAQMSNNSTSPSAVPSNAGLPPKPPAQEKPIMHPNYASGEALRTLQNSQAQSSQPAPTSGTNASMPTQQAYGLPAATPTAAPGIAAPGSAAPGTVQQTQAADVEGAPFDAHMQQLYDQFIQFERSNVQSGDWDKFPNGSRLFVGNLSSERVHKREVFRKFHKYGQLAQISIKQAYGFVQFMDTAACATALAMEQGSRLGGREINLEVSKPAKATRPQNNPRDTRRRSRSPDYNRGAHGGRVDRYTSAQMSPRDRDNRRSRESWSGRRSPSPDRRYGGRPERNDTYGRSRSPERYNGGVRYGTPPQQAAELDVPWRASHQVPDIQIIVVDPIDDEYIRWVDGSVKSRGVKSDVFMLSPRYSEDAVIRRQVLEGVQAVMHLTHADRMKNKVSLRVFKRSAGNSNVSFDQYVDLDPTTAADLVVHAKQSQQQAPPRYQPQQQPYGQNGQAQSYNDYSRAASHQPQAQAYTNMQGPHNPLVQPGHSAPATSLTPDVSRLLGQLGQPPSQQSPYGAPPHSLHGSYQQAPSSVPASAPPRGAPIPPPTSQNSPDIQQLLANLTNYKPPG